jgi:hypothetical protein
MAITYVEKVVNKLLSNPEVCVLVCDGDYAYYKSLPKGPKIPRW